MSAFTPTPASSGPSALGAPAERTAPAPNGFGALGHGDFLKLLVVQLQQQDPFDPVDNKDMLAQMAQFSALAGTSETNATLQAMAARLDALVAATQHFAAHLPQDAPPSAD